jgi:hypothetical protein
MRKSFLLSCIVLALCGRALAGIVSVETAQAVALNYFKLNAPGAEKTTLTATLKYTQAESNGAVDFYVFDMAPVTGFVIVTAYDNVEPVIGFSTETNFKTNFKNNGLVDWTKSSAERINYAAVNNLAPSAEVSSHWLAYKQGVNPAAERASSVAPLAVTTWDQENDISNPPPYLYNLDCPYNSSEGERCVTGCVATAMAQIMAYWAYPSKGTGSYSYTSKGYGTQSVDFGTTTYNWAGMPSVLTKSTSTSADELVDLISYDAGVAVAMEYGTDEQGGSGAWVLQSDAGSGKPCAQQAYVKYFGYDASTIQGLNKSSYSASAWTTLIEGELNAGRIVQYAGQGPDGGHTWLCDGYNTKGLYHMNWGWGGADNGYFTITKLDVDGTSFNSDDEALIGIEPPSKAGVEEAPFASGSKNTTGGGKILTFDAASVSTVMTLYPNPVQNNLNLQFGSSTDGTITVNVYNVTGQRVISTEQSSVAGNNMINLNTSALSAGVYVFEMQNNGEVQRQQFVIAK